MSLNCKLKVNGKEIPINAFVQRILSRTLIGAVSSLSGIDEDWKNIDIEVQKS